MGITNIGTPQVEIALSEIGLFELAVDAIKQQLELKAISDSLSVLGQSAGFKFDLNLPANTQALVSQGISAGIHKRSVLSVETRTLIAQAEGIHIGGDKSLFPKITPVILGLSETGLTVQRQASLVIQNLYLNDSNTWFMRSDLPEGFFKLVRQLESRQSIRTLEEFRLVRELEYRQAFRTPEENRATIMESP